MSMNPELEEALATLDRRGHFSMVSRGKAPSGAMSHRGNITLCDIPKRMADALAAEFGGEVVKGNTFLFNYRARGAAAYHAGNAMVPHLHQQRAAAMVIVNAYRGALGDVRARA